MKKIITTIKIGLILLGLHLAVVYQDIVIHYFIIIFGGWITLKFATGILRGLFNWFEYPILRRKCRRIYIAKNSRYL